MHTNWIRALAAAFVMALIVIVLLAALEAYLQYAKPAVYENDRELGWKLRPNVDRTIDNLRFDQSRYQAHITTDALGLREAENNPRPALTMLVLGDSFTADPFSGNDDMWYVIGARQLEKMGGLQSKTIRTLGGGGGGYGNFQELLLLRHLKRKVSPDVFVLQFCANDFMNNHLATESDGIVRSQYMRRPYYSLDGSVAYDDSPFAWLWRHYPTGESKIFNKIDGLIQGLQYAYYHDYLRPGSPGATGAYNQEMLAVTAELLKQLRREMADIPAVMVSCSASKGGLNAQWEKLGQEAGFITLAAPSDAIEKSKRDKKLFYLDGAHLSPEGNELYGRAFAQALSEQGRIAALLKEKARQARSSSAH